MIVCVCNNISDREIRQAVELGLSSMDELRRDLGVATCCGKCDSFASDVLKEHLESRAVPAPTEALRETVLRRHVLTS
jgi:bacterioferritin-associated ferredoxin